MEERIMKKTFVLFAAFVACITLSCNKINEEVVDPETGMKTVTITATIDEPETRTSYADGTGAFSWTAGDEISVLCDDNNVYTFTANSTAATSTFTGNIPSGVGLGARAFFPADAAHDVLGYSYHIPESKDISGHPSADIPMVGTKSGNAYLFSHCCGATKLTIDNIPSTITKVLITVSHPSLKLSGSFSVFTSGGYYRWNADAAGSESEKVFSRKVAVSSNTASIFIPYASGGDWWGTNTVNVIGYDALDTPTNLIVNKAMASSIGAVERAHIKPLTPLPVNKLPFIDWTDAGISDYTVSYGGSSMRILDWKGTSDKYYVYFRFRINKAKIAYDDTNSTYDSSDASYIYIAFDTGDGGAAASGGIQGGAIYEAQAFVRPFTGTTKGTIEFKEGDDPSSYIDCPVGTHSGSKVTTTGYIDGSDAYVSIAIPRSKIGSPASASTIHVQAAMNYYYTDTGDLVLE